MISELTPQEILLPFFLACGTEKVKTVVAGLDGIQVRTYISFSIPSYPRAFLETADDGPFGEQPPAGTADC